MFINWALQEIQLKIVYYGPGLSGKTTNLNYIYKNLDPSIRGELVSLNTREDRTIFFDFLQFEIGRIKNKQPKFGLYTIPGQSYYAESRRIILNGVDGIVFVADSQQSRLSHNLELLQELEEILIESGQTLQSFPWIIQYNKRDLEKILPVETLQRKLNYFNVPHFQAVAMTGQGVFASLKAIINLVIANIQRRLT
ncbi:GTPase domain-containing protein [candidate division KSB1 bacterium]|nr:GTPase domain-containing protein [candidate division KSB1 bacterium]